MGVFTITLCQLCERQRNSLWSRPRNKPNHPK